MEYKYLRNHGNTTWKHSLSVTPKKYIGFVYQIKNKRNELKYIGKAQFWRKLTMPPLKGKKQKRHFMKETNWRKYNGSGNFKDIINKNPKQFEKSILYNCKTITELKLREIQIQLDYYFSGKWNELYNEMINIRLRIRK